MQFKHVYKHTDAPAHAHACAYLQAYYTSLQAHYYTTANYSIILPLLIHRTRALARLFFVSYIIRIHITILISRAISRSSWSIKRTCLPIMSLAIWSAALDVPASVRGSCWALFISLARVTISSAPHPLPLQYAERVPPPGLSNTLLHGTCPPSVAAIFAYSTP
jgi:hypothetical protein